MNIDDRQQYGIDVENRRFYQAPAALLPEVVVDFDRLKNFGNKLLLLEEC